MVRRSIIFALLISHCWQNQSEWQHLISNNHLASTRFGLKICTSNTEVQGIAREPSIVNIKICETKLKQVEQFTYLGSVMSQDASCKHDINLATSVAAALDMIWSLKAISKKTKAHLYQALALSVLYKCETWNMRRLDEHKLQVFEMAVLRKISGVSLRDRCINEEIRAALESKISW